MSEYYSYVTKENDRWDLIAYKFYGDPTKYETIIKANLNLIKTPVLTAGIKLRIPILPNEESINFELPPWRK